MLSGLYQHRLLTTPQIHRLYTPHAGARWTRKALGQLKQRGLVDRVRDQHIAHWFLTEQGADAVEAASSPSEPRRRVLNRAQAEGPLRAHTIAVNEVGVAFVQAAQQRADECSADSWRNEIAHPISRGSIRHPAQLVIADALLTYLQAETDGTLILHQRFIELDRGTRRPADQLAAKLARYTQLRTHTPTSSPDAQPAWRAYYRSWPHLLVVLADQTPARIQQRIHRTLALYQSDPGRDPRRAIPFTFVALNQLTLHGPFAPIFTSPTHNEPVNWLGNPQPKDG
jgi:Replication-relaxation